jgi:hypothetical protein
MGRVDERIPLYPVMSAYLPKRTLLSAFKCLPCAIGDIANEAARLQSEEIEAVISLVATTALA